MQTKLIMSLGRAAVLALMVSGCGSTGAAISAQNPSFFGGRVSENAMSGAFNASGFTSSQVRKLVSETCKGGRLSGFNAQDREDGLTGFAATCPRWKNGALAVEFERSSGSTVGIEITGADGSGALIYNRINASV